MGIKQSEMNIRKVKGQRTITREKTSEVILTHFWGVLLRIIDMKRLAYVLHN